MVSNYITSVYNGMLFQQNRHREQLRKNRETRVKREIDTYVANQLKQRMK